MALYKLLAALAALLVVTIATSRPASASRPSSGMGSEQEAVPLIGIRHRQLVAVNPNPKCPVNYSVCGQSCANLKSDADNCGACGKVCGNNQQCTNGACTPFAAAGPTVATASTKTKTSLTKCYAPAKGNTPRTYCYYDTKCSNNNCGGCGKCCPWDAYCQNGDCICPINKCLCNVNGKLKCLGHGEYCPEKKNFCCKAGYTSCASGCCPKCSDPNGGVCQTNGGNVCCPTRHPGTRCYGPPGGRQCCPVGYWTGSTTRQCCNKAGGEKPTKCEAGPGDKSPPTVCCPNDLPCRYNANPDPAKPGKVIGYACISQTCAPPATIDPQCTETTNELTDPPCCCTKCKAPYVPKCPVVNGNLDKTCNEADKCGCTCPERLWTGSKCCPKKKCGKTCCANANDVCYTKNGQQACCPSSRWDPVSKVCCAAALCDTKDGKRCCATGTRCRDPSPIVAKNSVCCADSQWIGAPRNQCCPADKTPVKCEARSGDRSPPTLCCDPGLACKYNNNPDPAKPGKIIGYACISQSCPPPTSIHPKCTAATSETTDPSCCCTKCSDGFVPQCPASLPKGCNEPGGSGCGCKCLSKKVCSNTKCCPNADDACYSVAGKPACCPKGRWTGTKCCPVGQKNCNGECINQDICCTNADCPCPVATGAAFAAARCDSCCQQYLCCNIDGQRKCIPPNDTNCSACGKGCAEGETCNLNTCIPQFPF